MMRADFIPAGPDQSHRNWFASDHGLWLYWTPSSKIAPQRSHVDPLVRPVLNLLAKAGCVATPSSQGRLWSDSDVRRVYEALVADRRQIRGSGLSVTNTQTLKTSVYHNPSYALPWSNWTQMKRCLTSRGKYSPKGFIGVVNQWEDPEYIVSALNAHLPKRRGFQTGVKKNIIGITVAEPDPDLWLDVQAAWRYALTIVDCV